jgi:hypothetical protein
MKLNPFWVLAFVVLVMIGLLNFESIIKSAQDTESSPRPSTSKPVGPLPEENNLPGAYLDMGSQPGYKSMLMFA